jgi:NADH-quinone oxidoreductase subunit L
MGVGTLNPIGIAGALFHMANHATYKSCLFMTAGAVEKQAGTSDLNKLGGLFRAMPVTGLCFLVAGAAISGIAPLNGFFSKELLYRGTLLTGYTPFFLAAELGSFLTLSSMLKLGHSVFFGARPAALQEVKEAPLLMLLPMLLLAGVCVAFGFGAHLPADWLISPALGALNLPVGELSGFHLDKLFAVSLIVVLAAVINHILGLSAAGGKAAEVSGHVSRAPGLKEIYEMAGRRAFDLYEQAMDRAVPAVSGALFKADRFFDWMLDTAPSSVAGSLGGALGRVHNGAYPLYMALTLIAAAVYILLAGGFK